MAIKASASVTLATVVDVEAVWRFYLLQSSTLAPPPKPTAYPPPAAWNDTEPGYNPALTQTLYVVDCNVFSDGLFEYTPVSVSASFEAAKAAYNKAAGAESAAGEAAGKADSNTEAIVELTRDVSTDIVESHNAIMAEVSDKYYIKGEADRIVSEVSTQLVQTQEDFTFTFTRFEADLQAVAAWTDAEFDEIRRYIRFDNGRILLGQIGNELELRIANDRIGFYDNNAEVAYLSNNRLYVTDATILTSLQLGDFAFFPRANGNLSFRRGMAATTSNIVGLALVGIAEAGG